MHIVAIHSISDPKGFWSGSLDLPEGTTLQSALPNNDGTKGVCVWKSDSVETVTRLVESAAGEISDNEYFEVNANQAQGLPA
jgi:hypothetical protein